MRLFKKIVLASTILSSVGLATQAFAQDAAKTGDTTKAADEPVQVIVTGTHIRRKDLNTASPEITITSQQAVEAGNMTVADLLQKLPQAANSEQTNSLLGSYIVTGGPGSETLSLFGLGAQNTLVLVNGRRMGPAGVQGKIGPIDLNVLPLQAFKQVDILLDGSSSIYGSDAVGGVINFVTKKNTDGMDLIVQGDVPFKPHGSDYTLTFTGGKTFDKGYLTLLGSYHEETGLRIKDRKDTACAANVYFDPSTGQRSDFIDSTTGTYKCLNLWNNAVLGYGFGGNFQYLPGFTPPADGRAPYLPAGWVRAGRSGHPDTFPYQNYDTPMYGNQTVMEPVKTASLLATGGYDVSSTMHLYTELLFNQRDSENHSVLQLFPFVDPSNPENTLAPGLQSVGGLGYVQPIIPYDNFTRVKVDYFRGVFGVNGTFEHMGPLNGFSYDTYYQISDSEGRYGQSFIYNDRVNATTGPGVACDPTQMTVSPAACVTIPWLDSNVLQGNLTDAQRNFLIGYETGHTQYIQQTIESNISGNIFQLPAGAVSAVGGIFLEADQENDKPGYNARNQNYWGFSTAGITKGQTTSEQAYAEIYAPLVKNAPFVQHLDLTVSGRAADYSVAGTNSTYKLGLVWNINSEFAFTVTRGTSFRAPSVYEKNLANQVGFFQVIDPCTNWADSNDTKIQTRCAAEGVPGNYPGDVASPEDITGGGNKLKPETARNTNFGFAWTPAWADLKVKVNYNSIIDLNQINAFGGQNIVNACYATDAFPNFFCSLITRDANSNITAVTDNYINIGEVDNRNIGLEVTYAKKFPFGRFSVRSNSSWQLKNQDTLGDVVTDYTGSIGSPVFTSSTYLDLVTSDWTYHWDFQLIGKSSDLRFYNGSARQPATPTYPNGFVIDVVAPFYQVHNLSVTRDFDKLRLTFGVKNVFDVKAPTLSYPEFRVGTAALNMYDLLGRMAFLTVDKHF
jgi:iron complex outermembrane receptor protein